ncbi:MAG: hypothetical protein FJ125_09740, partial [Deltaproteobacteria bacterium]|nr:hypothetical protein [Deltaproteobacteria bacterium]
MNEEMMTQELATTVFFAIVMSPGFFWGLATRFAYHRVMPQAGRDRHETGVPVLRGELLLTGEPEALSRRIATLLSGAAGGLAMLRITERTGERVCFEKRPGASALPVFDRGSIRLEAQGGQQVRIRYEASLGRFTSRLRLAWVLVCFAYCGLFVTGTPLHNSCAELDYAPTVALAVAEPEPEPGEGLVQR